MKLRRSMLFVPGNNPSIIRDSYLYHPDSVMFDLEDSISINEKDSARYLLYNMIQKMKPLYKKANIEMIVRINALDTEYGIKDIEAMVKAGIEVIRIPKTETVEDVKNIERYIEQFEKEANRPIGDVKIFIAIENSLGALNSLAISKCSPRIVGIALGAEDYVTSLKTTRSKEGTELFMARALLVMNARAAGISVIDAVFSNINDDEGFLEEARIIRQMGFDGKSLIHPKQIDLINQVYTPDEKSIQKSLKIVNAAKEALKEGKGVITVDGRMVDKPIIERAENVLLLAKAAGLKLEGELYE